MTEPTVTVPSRVFITGASGFIGRALARYYRGQGAEVSGIDFKADLEWGVTAGDLARTADWSDQLQGVDLVIHTAAVVSNTVTMDFAWRVNVKATVDLLNASANAGVKRFIQLSSVAAYGFDYPQGISKSYGQVSYAELKSGSIMIKGKKIPTVPLSSMVKARKIADILKRSIQKATFFIGQPQHTFY